MQETLIEKVSNYLGLFYVIYFICCVEWTVEAFGSQLLTKNGLRNTVDVLANKKYVGIYFSAHWVSF